jgi:hypothetical protein
VEFTTCLMGLGKRSELPRVTSNSVDGMEVIPSRL